MDGYSEHMKTFTLEERLRVASYYEGKAQWDKGIQYRSYNKAAF